MYDVWLTADTKIAKATYSGYALKKLLETSNFMSDRLKPTKNYENSLSDKIYQFKTVMKIKILEKNTILS